MPVAQEAVALLVAVARLADEFDVYTCTDIGPKLTCTEAERLAEVIRLAGRPEHASALLAAHIESDDDGDWHLDQERPDVDVDEYDAGEEAFIATYPGVL